MSHFTPYFLCLFLMLLALIFYFFHKNKSSRIKHWQKSLHLQEHAKIFEQLYQDANGYILSQQARQGRDAMEYTYGEIEFISFIALLSLTKPNESTVFYDLGSGTGKAVLAGAMVFSVHQCVGVELFPELYFDACKRVERLATMKNYADKAKKIKFILGDFLEVNLNDATHIFINSSAFFGPTWEKLCAKIEPLTQLHTVITTSKALACDNYTLTRSTKVEMSWGIVFAYIHTRKTKLTNCLEKIE